MKIYPPLGITGRLLPGIVIGEAVISIEYSHRADSWQYYRWFIDLNCQHFQGDNLVTTVSVSSLQEGLRHLLHFLGAFAKAHQYWKSNPSSPKPDNVTLFPVGLADWAVENAEEIAMLESTLMDKILIEE